MMPMIGVSACAGFSFRNAAAFSPIVLAELKLANHSTILSE